MNIVRIRELLKDLKGNALSTHEFDTFMLAPVFLFNRDEDTITDTYHSIDKAWMDETLQSEGYGGIPTKMPYQAFIIVDEAASKRSVFLVLGGARKDISNEGEVTVKLTIWNIIPSDRVALKIGYRGKKEGGLVARHWKNGKPWDVWAVNDLGWVGASMLAIVKTFCFEVMSNTSAVIKVSPKPDTTRPVEWHLSRTHYCILQKKEAMEIRDKRKPIDSDTIVRSAHWRRAHWRTLKSDKFTHKKGHRVPVSEAWIGPDEWIGLDNKTYKVMQ